MKRSDIAINSTHGKFFVSFPIGMDKELEKWRISNVELLNKKYLAEMNFKFSIDYLIVTM